MEGELYGLRNMFKFSKDHNSSLAKQVFERMQQVENGVVVAKYHAPKFEEKVRDYTWCYLDNAILNSPPLSRYQLSIYLKMTFKLQVSYRLPSTYPFSRI